MCIMQNIFRIILGIKTLILFHLLYNALLTIKTKQSCEQKEKQVQNIKF